MASRPMRDGSAQRLGSWRAIENTGIAAGECVQLIREYARARKVNRSGVDNMRKMSGQRMEGAALIVQTEHAVMVVSIGIREGRFGRGVPVGGDRRRFIHIQRVVADQRNDSRHLRNHEEYHQAGAEAADSSYAGHGPELLPPHSRRRPARPAAANMPQCETISRGNRFDTVGRRLALLHAASSESSQPFGGQHELSRPPFLALQPKMREAAN